MPTPIDIVKIIGAVNATQTAVSQQIKQGIQDLHKSASELVRETGNVFKSAFTRPPGTFTKYDPGSLYGAFQKNPQETAISSVIALGTGPTAIKGKTQAQATQIFEDLTTKTLNRLKGKTSVPTEYIQNLIRMPDVKQVERELIQKKLTPYQQPKSAQTPVSGVSKKYASENSDALSRSKINTVWHETDPQKARDLIFASGDKTGLNVATNPDLALGQSGKGVKIEMDTAKLSGNKINKPASGFIESQTGLSPEYRITDAPSNLNPFVKSVVFDKPLSPKGERFFFGLRDNWKATKELLPNGKIKYTNPNVAQGGIDDIPVEAFGFIPMIGAIGVASAVQRQQQQ